MESRSCSVRNSPARDRIGCVGRFNWQLKTVRVYVCWIMREVYGVSLKHFPVNNVFITPSASFTRRFRNEAGAREFI